ncbi:MAG TPA: hypothetical protein VF688_14525 [Allosphingosinicella sp.]|jgi:hypothetical protein
MAEEIEIAPEKARTMAVRDEPGRLSIMAEPPSPPVLARLHALVRRGYTAELGAPGNPDRLVLRHLGLAPDLVLHSNGDLEGLDARRPRFKRHIDPPAPIGGGTDSDHLRFMRFLDTVPKATFWHRNRPWRKKYLYLPAVLVVVWFVCVMLTVTVISP